jgi:hypothetical protein
MIHEKQYSFQASPGQPNSFALAWAGRSSFTIKFGVSVHQDLQGRKSNVCIFWDQNLCVVFDAHSPISLTGIDKIQHLSSICIYIILLRFTIHQASRSWLKVEVIHATKR